MEKSRGFLIYLFYLILILTWGSSFILMKIGLQYYTPPQVATIRMVSALIALIGLAVFHVRKIPLHKFGYVAISGIVGMFFPAFLFCYAEAGMSSAIAGILNALVPTFTLIIGALFFKQRIKRAHVLGLIIGFSGILLLILINPVGQLALNSYAFLVIAATICYGLNINIVKHFLADVDPLPISTVSVSISGILALIYMLFKGGLHLIPLNAQNKTPLLAAIALGVFGTAMAQSLFNQLIKKTSGLFASTIVYVLPIVAIFWGVLYGEKLVPLHYCGMLLIIIGIVVIRQPAFLKRWALTQ